MKKTCCSQHVGGSGAAIRAVTILFVHTWFQVISLPLFVHLFVHLSPPSHSLSLSLSQVVKNGSDTECSYWDQALDRGYGAWSTEGCSLVEESYDKATCECNHLTNFAVLRVSLHALS